MPGGHTEVKVDVYWYAIDRNPETNTETRDPAPMVHENWDRRRAWTIERDLVAASPDRMGSYWRRPTEAEMQMWDLTLDLTAEDTLAGITEKRWLVAVGCEPDIPKQHHAVLLVESQR